MTNRSASAIHREAYSKQRTVITSSTTETAITTPAAPHTFFDLVRILITNKSTTTDVNVTIRQASGDANGADFAVPAGQTVGWSAPPEAAEPQLTPGVAWTAQCDAAVDSVVIHGVWLKNQ